MILFFFSSRRRHTRLQGDWSSDVCSSDLARIRVLVGLGIEHVAGVGAADVRAQRAFHPLRIVPRSEERRVGKEGRIVGMMGLLQEEERIAESGDRKQGREKRE